MSLKKITFALLTLAALLAASASAALAQTSRGTVTGILTDPNGAVVQGATVTLVSKETGLKRETTSNEAGIYRFDAVDLGNYDLTVAASGFANRTLTGIQVQANQITTLDAQLAVGTQSEVVEVTASSGELIQKSDPVRGGNFTPIQVQSLPTSSLNAYDLGRLLPGAVTATGGAQFGNASQFSINGQRPRGNNYLIDGTENNDISVTGPATTPSNEDAIAEVSVQTGLFSAEFGRAGGGVFNVITKSGGNAYHGSLRELFQSERFNALTNTQKVSGLTRPPVFTENTFGGTIGGPLPLPRFGEGGPALSSGKDKNFFFFGLQFDRFRATAQFGSFRAPTEAGVQTLRSLFPAGTNPRVDLYLQAIGSVRGNPNVSPSNIVLGIGPTGTSATPVNRGTVQTGLTFVFAPQVSNDRQWVIRTDHNINQNHKISFRYNDDNSIFTPSSVAVNPQFFIDIPGVSRNLLVTHTWIVNPTTTNELRVSPYGLIDFQFPVSPNASPLASTLQNIGISGLSTVGLATNLPQFRTAKNFLVQETMTKLYNSHTFRFGAEFLRQTAKQRPPFNERGSFAFTNGGTFTGGTYSALANFIDNFSGPRGSANINFGTPFYEPNLFRQSYFFQDTWKTTQALTLTLGLRYEDFGQPANSAFKFPAFAGFDPANFLVPNKVEPDRNNFGPIVGFAYAPTVNSGPFAKGVVRGGYQVSYDTWFNNLLSNIAADSPNNTSTTTTAAATGRGNANFFPGALPSTARTPSPLDQQTSVFNPHIRNPYTQRYSLGYQRELPFKLFMDVSYVGSLGRKLFVTEDLNPIVNPATGARRFPALGIRRYRSSGANSDYNSGQLRVDRRFSQGIVVTTSYTWSKTMDQISEVFATGQTNSSLASVPAFLGGLKLDRAVSDYHRKHRFTASYVWDLPIFRERKDAVGNLLGGWQLNGVAVFQSGAPFTIVNGQDRNGDGVSTSDRPDVGNPNAPHNTRAVIVPTTGAGSCATGLQNPDTGACVTRNDVYVVQAPINTGTSLVFPGPATIGRNTERSKPVQNFDMSLFKTFRFTENVKLETRLEAFNVFNHPQLTGIPNADVTNSSTGTFLNFDLLSGGSRSARVGFKILF